MTFKPHHIDSGNRIALGALMATMILCNGCISGTDATENSSTPQPFTEADEDYETIARVLQADGFDIRDMRHRDDRIWVEGDMIFRKSEVLSEATQLTEKGYSILGKTVPRVGQPYYDFKNWTRCIYVGSLSTSWQDAVNHAIDQWAAQGFRLKRWSACTPAEQRDNKGAVYYQADTADTFAAAALGQLNACTGDFHINNKWKGNCGGATNIEDLSSGFKRKIAMHELGHGCSFQHPPDLKHIDGTASGTGYSTVMEQGCSGKNSLTSDDILSAAKIQNH